MITTKKNLTNDFDLIRIASHLQKEIEDLNKENDFYVDMIIRLEKNLQIVTSRLKEIEIHLSIS
jgi:hypothetical protein